MTENRPRDAVDLLYEAAEFANFDASKGWPDELGPSQFVALMVGHEWLRPLGEPQPVTVEHPDGQIEQLGPGLDLAAMEAGTERARKRRSCRIVEKMLRDAGIAIEERTETIHHSPVKLFQIDPNKRPTYREQPPEIRRWHVVTKGAAMECLKRIGKEPPEYARAWLGDAWLVGASATAMPTNWNNLSPEEKRAAWLKLSREQKRENVLDAMKRNHGNKTRAGAEFGISRTLVRELFNEAEPTKPPEAPLPVNQYTVGLGLVKSKRDKAST